MRVGLYGGTFDPVHNGHMRVIDYALSCVDALFIVPAGCPYMKDRDITPLNIRVEMLLAATQNIERTVIVTMEPENRPSYTVDSLQKIKSLYPYNEAIYLFVGEDAFKQMPQWKDYNTIERMSHIIPIKRTYESSTDIRKLAQEDKDISIYVPKSVQELIVEYGLYKKEISYGSNN